MSALVAWCLANQALIATVLFAVSEALGANPKERRPNLRSPFFINMNRKRIYR